MPLPDFATLTPETNTPPAATPDFATLQELSAGPDFATLQPWQPQHDAFASPAAIKTPADVAQTADAIDRKYNYMLQGTEDPDRQTQLNAARSSEMAGLKQHAQSAGLPFDVLKSDDEIMAGKVAKARLTPEDIKALLPFLPKPIARAASAVESGVADVAGGAASPENLVYAAMGRPVLPAFAGMLLTQGGAQTAGGIKKMVKGEPGGGEETTAGILTMGLGALPAGVKPETPKAELPPETARPTGDALPLPRPVTAPDFETLKPAEVAAPPAETAPLSIQTGVENAPPAPKGDVTEAPPLAQNVENPETAREAPAPSPQPSPVPTGEGDGPSRILSQVMGENIDAREPLPASLVDQYNAAAETPYAMPEGYVREGPMWVYHEPETKLTQEQIWARENVAAMAELQKQKEQEAGGAAAPPPEAVAESGSTPATGPKTESPEPGMALPLGERPPDILDWIADNYRRGVRTTSQEDYGEYVKTATGAARDLISNIKGERGDAVLKEMHDQGQWPRIETEDQLYQAMHEAAGARKGWAETNRQAAKATPDAVENWFNAAIQATRPDLTKVNEGLTGAPVWITKGAANAALRVAKIAYTTTRDLTKAIAAGIEHLRSLGLKDFNETEAQQWLGKTIGEQQGKGQRQFAEQLQNAPDISPELKGAVTNTKYMRRPQEDDQAYAGRIVDQAGGPGQAIAEFRDRNNGLPPSVRMALGMQIIKRLDAAKDYRAASDFFDGAFAQHTTDAAQGLAMLNSWSALSADGKLFWAQKKLSDARRDTLAPVQPDIEAAKTEVQRLNAKGIESATASPDVQTAAHAAADEAVRNSAETHKAVVMEMAEPWASSEEVMSAARAQVRSKVNELMNRKPALGFTAQMQLKKMLDDVAARAASIAAAHFQGVEPGTLLKDKFKQRLGLDDAHAETLARQMDAKWSQAVKDAKGKINAKLANLEARRQLHLATAKSNAEQQALAAASRTVREAAARMAKAETDARVAQSARDKATADVQVKAAARAQKIAYETVRLAADRAAKAETERRVKEAAAYGGKVVGPAISKQLTALQLKMGRIVHEHFTKQHRMGQDLADTMVKEAGLSGPAAAKLASAVKFHFADKVTTAKQQALQKLLKPVQRLAKPGMVDKLVKLTNLGAFDDATFHNAIRERLNLPEWTPELRDQFKAIAGRIGKLPEDRVEDLQREQTAFMNTLERAKGISNLDLGLGFYISNLLSGLTTHARVAIHTSAQLVAATSAEFERALIGGRLHDIPLIFEALARAGGKALQQQKDVMRSGIVTGSKNQLITPLGALEQIRFGEKGGTTFKQAQTVWPLKYVDPTNVIGRYVQKPLLENRLAKILNLWKYNSRLITAQHLLYYKPAEEMKLALLASRQARTEGLTGKAATDRARQMLGYGAEAVRNAEAQAAREGLTGTRSKMRVGEILQSQLPKAMKETARDYALRQTFLNEPYGFAGALAGVVSKMKSNDNALLSAGARTIVPFARIAANLFNEGLNYTPMGAARARFARTELVGRKFADITLEQQGDLRAELYAKSALGSMLFTAIAFKAAQGLSQPNPQFAIYGAGPNNPQDKAAWRAAGGVPYSVKYGDRYVSYANTPANVFMAVLGDYLDGERDAELYQRPGARRLAENLPMRAAAATIGAGKVILEQPFLQSLLQLSDIANQQNPELASRGAIKTVARTVSSFAVPNIMRQVDRFYDPTVYQQRDVTGILANLVPFVRQGGRPLLNALGDPIASPVFGLFTQTRTPDKFIQLLTDHNIWPSIPNRNSTDVNGVPLTDDEFYTYVKARGEALREMMSKPQFASALENVEKARDRLQAQAASTDDPVAKANVQAAARGLIQTQLLDQYEAAATKKAAAAVSEKRGY